MDMHADCGLSAASLPRRRRKWAAPLFAIICLLAALPADGQEAQWIWSPEHRAGSIPHGSCYFRKQFSVGAVEEARVLIAADDAFELFVNGRRVGSGESHRRLEDFNIRRFLNRGRNVVAVHVENRGGSTAALVARVQVKERGRDWQSFSTDATWRTHLRPLPLWNANVYNDSRWRTAHVYGPLGDTVPWDRRETVAQNESDRGERFTIAQEFRVQRLLDSRQTGSVLAITFNEFGHLLVSREGGPLLLVHDSNEDGLPDTVRTYCDQVTSCQGILALNGDVYVTGTGPDGSGLYRLSDTDRDGTLEQVRTLVRFRGESPEHGAHGLTLGPDGLIYVIVGNHAVPERAYDESSPHTNHYEGDLAQPRYEDPGGHARGIRGAGGVVLRTDTEGSSVQLVCGGLRNAYDLVFNRDGELFVHDSDMESDTGTPWYRPTRLYHIISGGEFGWRSGWAKWPEYFADSLPGILDTGRGSPTGAVTYDHHMFPARYHGALFLADWSEGRILAVNLERAGATYTAGSEVFLSGQPLNVTDLEVGPDGGLYFSTGGRGTSGGIYRVTWRGEVPAHIRQLGSGIGAAIRQPQIHSAWGRQEIARIKSTLGADWGDHLRGVAVSTSNSARYRTRALDLMQLFGPPANLELLLTLSRDANESVRARAAQLLAKHSGEAAHAQLIAMLQDDDRYVRRCACESLVQFELPVPFEALQPLLSSDDRFESWAARRLLERQPVEHWKNEVLTSQDHRVFVKGSLALLVAYPTTENAEAVIDRFTFFLDGFISDRNFIDMLRVVQVALHRSEAAPDTQASLRQRLGSEFPAGNPYINRELTRILVHVQAGEIIDRFLAYLEADVSPEDRLHVAFHLRFLESGWQGDQRLRLVGFLEQSTRTDAGSSYTPYLIHVTRDVCRSLRPEEREAVLANGESWPNAALGVLYSLPTDIDRATHDKLTALDQALSGAEHEAHRRLRVGILAVLARSGHDEGFAYLREVFEREPERRGTVAMGLAQSPTGANWEVLIRSLPVLEGPVARDVLQRLAQSDRVPEDPEAYRQVILRGLELQDEGADAAIQLLDQWTSSPQGVASEWESTLAAWQQWYREEWPARPPAELPTAEANERWRYPELLEYLTGDEATEASAERGAAVFVKAQCAQCHRSGSQGDSIGPDLSTVARTFTRREILQSIVYPSHVISSQYANRRIILEDGRVLVGMVTPGGEGELTVLRSDGTRVLVREADIDELLPDPSSAMPSGLLNELTLEEISDLFAYLYRDTAPAVTRRPEE